MTQPNQYSNKKDSTNDNIHTVADLEDYKNYKPTNEEIKQAHKDLDRPLKKDESHKPKEKQTIIRENLTKKEYDKLNIPYPGIEQYDRLERFERLTRGNWTRKVTSISWIRTIDDEEFLDWNETRYGKTDAKRPLEEAVSHVGQYRIPIPLQTTEFDPEMEEYKLVTQDRPSDYETGYLVKYSKDALDELMADIIPYKTEYNLIQINGKPLTISKKEITGNHSFDKLYTLKSGVAEDK